MYDYRCEIRSSLCWMPKTEIWMVGEMAGTSKPCAHGHNRWESTSMCENTICFGGDTVDALICLVSWKWVCICFLYTRCLLIGAIFFYFSPLFFPRTEWNIKKTIANTRCQLCKTPYPKINRIYSLWCIHTYPLDFFSLLQNFGDNLI